MLRNVTAFATLLALYAFVPSVAFAMDGVVMKDSHMMMMKNGKPTEPMPADMTMPDGTKVTTTGVVKMKDGQVKHLTNGDIILMDGHIMTGGKATPMQPQ